MARSASVEQVGMLAVSWPEYLHVQGMSIAKESIACVGTLQELLLNVDACRLKFGPIETWR